MVTEEMLTLIINALRDVAESKRMPSGLQVTEGVARLHEEAAIEMEHYRKALRATQLKTTRVEGAPSIRSREDELS
jgi:hypothetical protein